MEDASDLVPGVDYPRTFQEVDEWFRSDAACREYIRRLRWPNGFICPHCGWTGEPWMTSRGLLHCQGCQGQTSLTAGTIFQDTRKPLRMWFMAMWYVTNQKNGVRAVSARIGSRSRLQLFVFTSIFTRSRVQTRTGSALVLWGCNVFLASAVTRRPGLGCTSCAGQWFALEETRSVERWRLTRPMLAVWKKASAAGIPKPRP